MNASSPDSKVPKEKSLLNRDFILITLAGFIFFFNFHSFLLLPIRIENLGGSEAAIGFIMGAASFSTIFTTPAVGSLVDRWGKKWFLAAGGLLMSVTTFPFAYIDSLNFLFPLLRVIHGAAFSLCFVSAGTLTTDVTPASKRTQALGLFGVFTIINYALAPYLGKKIIEMYSFETFFLIDFIFGFLSFIVALLIREPEVKEELGMESGSTFRIALFREGVFASATALMIAGSGFIATLTFIPVYAKRIGIESFDFFFIAYTVSVLAVRIFGGWIPDRVGKKKAATPSLLFFSLSIVGIGLISDLNGLLAMAVVFGLCHGFLYPAIYALVIDLSLEVDRGKAFAICSVAFTLGGMWGSFLYGLVADFWGFRPMYVVMGTVCLAGFAVFGLYGKDKIAESSGGKAV